ncbi:MAG: 30S ribosomal protein S21 [Elusimicrobiota bacterium]
MYKGPKVEKKDRESINSVLKRFRRACSSSGIKNELKKRRFYRPPSEIRKIAKSKKERNSLRRKRKAEHRKERINTRKRRG